MEICNGKYKERLVQNVVLWVLIIIGSCVFFKLLSDYSDLRKESYALELRLADCEERLYDSGEQIGYQEKAINTHRYEKGLLNQEVVSLRFKMNEIIKNPLLWIEENYKSYNLEVTAYSPSVDECDDTPFINASGQYVDDFDIAVSQNMRKNGWDFGKFIYIPDHDKFYKIADVMNKRYTKRVDIFMWEKKKAKDFGFCDLDMYLIN